MTIDTLLTLHEAAEIAGIGPGSLRSAIRRGYLRGAVKRGRDWYVDRASLDTYLTHRRPRPRRIWPIWSHPVLPYHWVVEHDGFLWIVPNVAGGWERRTGYPGYREQLQPLDPAASGRLIAAFICLPGAGAES